MKRAYSYIRFSTTEQRKGASLDRQTELSQKWCDQNGYYLDDSLSLSDLGVSAFSGDNVDRGKLGAFLKACDAGSVRKGSALIVESLDRISRQEVPDALELFLGILNRGVDIVTLSPTPQFFCRKTLSEIQLIIAIVIMTRAYEESAIKSARLKDQWQRRRARISDGPIGGRIPSWVKLNDAGDGFEVIEEKAAIVRRIYRLSLEGTGASTIARIFNREKIAPISGRAKAWSDVAIRFLTRTRTVMGEKQPHAGKIGNRSPIGEAVKDYYPQIISEETFYAVQGAIDGRQAMRGPSTQCRNIFAGLVYDLRNGEMMTIKHKHKEATASYLVNLARRRATTTDDLPLIPYYPFEEAILAAVTELRARDILPHDGVALDLDDQVASAEAKLADLDNQIKQLQASTTGKNVAAVIELLAMRQAERDETAERADKLKAEQHFSAADHLIETQSVIEILAAVKDDEAKLGELRERVRSAIGRLIKRIDVVSIDLEGWSLKQVIAEIAFTAGGSRVVTMRIQRGKLARSATTASPLPSLSMLLDTETREKWALTLETLSQRPEKLLELIGFIGSQLERLAAEREAMKGKSEKAPRSRVAKDAKPASRTRRDLPPNVKAVLSRAKKARAK